MNTTRTAKRDRRNGQYTLEGNWNRVCAACGNTLGNHSAEAPHANDDLMLGPPCDGFKKSKTTPAPR